MVSLTSSAIWDEIEKSESYLVCCMFEEAITLSSSVVERLRKADYSETIQDVELVDMLESAGMVYVQALKELGRTSGILNELKVLFGSVTSIPVQVLLTGSCFLISDESTSDLSELLKEYLGKWRLVDDEGQRYVLANAENSNGAFLKGSDGRCILEIEKYLEVVEVYAVTLLGKVLNDTDNAIAWVEQAELPEGNRQDLLRRLRSLYSLKATKSSQDVETPMYETHADSGQDAISGVEQASSITSKASHSLNGRDSLNKESILKLSKRVEPCFWWYRSVTLKFGDARLVISHGKIVLWGSFFLFISYILRKKRATLKGIISKQASSVKKALLDMWQLAFSVQVNPLAAVQSLPSSTSR
ncbi:hypothetical protein MKW94_016278 [Papaver nudicaule]|uniref:3-phosphoinositide-dependent protein kinase-1 n=1 Tax=Papaver nudicaule TaxID=74823 RepID=A0AA41SDQ7_PAPNU|nr:hypothetical protein [Papaver nudicaule]